MIGDRLVDPSFAAVPAGIPHFQDPERINPVTSEDKIPEAAYGIALDHLVIACVDVLFTCEDQILLVKRNRYPRLSWWIIGGRMIAGENPQATAIRKAFQEVNLTLTPSRLNFVGVYSTCFAFRHQAPSHHGSHTLNITYQAELSETEKDQLLFHPEEHEIWQWINLNAVEQILDSHQGMDQALLRMIQDWQTQYGG